MDTTKLTVTKAYPNDSGRGIARLDPHTMMVFQLTPGDIIEIEGKKRTVAKVWRAERPDWDQKRILVDNFIRQNADAGIGDTVSIKKVEPKKAENIVLAPSEGKPIQFGGDAEEMVKRQILKRPIVKGDIIPVMSTMAHPFLGNVVTGQAIPLIAVESEPDDVVIITENTRITLRDKPVGIDVTGTGITYEHIGGLHNEVQRLRDMIELPLKHPEVFEKLGIESPKGVLMYGPPGTGKTLIAKAVANESGANFFSIAGPEIIGKYYGESEERIRKLFEEAAKDAPSIIFIDELDSIAPKREEVTGEVERRVVAQLLTMMDGLGSRGNVVVIGATNRIDAVDPALRRPGRFDREVEIGVPDAKDRIEIFQIHTRGMPLAEDIDTKYISDRTHGFVGADIYALAKEAAMKALRRYLPDIKLDEEVPQDVLDGMEVTASDFEEALKEVEPSAMREVLVEIPRVSWDEVGGLDAVKQEIIEAAEWPLKNPDKFVEMGIRPPKGILLYGPPGTGKTLLAKAVANESSANFISIRGPQLLSKWVGESERAIREIFKKAKQVSPAIIFLDELDAIAPVRGGEGGSNTTERVINQLLTELDGIEELKNVVVIAATNRPEIIDPALIRSGRFDRLVFVGAPDRSGRKEIFNIHLNDVPVSDEVNIDELADLTDNYVGSDIESLCREAVMLALRENFETEIVEMRHFHESLKKVRPALVEGMVEYYEKLQEQFKGGANKKEEQKSYIGYR